ncbi:hypothetical protein DAI22_07g092525 [Oryza sativa Japonica Group]|nr:hypothetical protein DAI22_07g092525 [Oryza sativa Japonica Group]
MEASIKLALLLVLTGLNIYFLKQKGKCHKIKQIISVAFCFPFWTSISKL